MKNIIKYMSLTFCSLLILSSCESDDSLYKSYSGENFISFKSNKVATLSISEDAGSFSIPVYISSPLDVDLTVELEYIENTATYGEHFTFDSTTVIIPAGQSETTFLLNLIDDDEFNESREFLMNIKSVSNSSITIGMSGNQASYSQKVIIANNDCPTKFNQWAGSISVNYWDTDPYETTLSGEGVLSGVCDVLILRVPNLTGYPTSSGVNDDYELTFIPYNEEGSIGEIQMENKLISTEAHSTFDLYYRLDSGTFNADTGVIFLEFTAIAIHKETGQYGGYFWSGTNTITVN